jgi:hypothetical protein
LAFPGATAKSIAEGAVSKNPAASRIYRQRAVATASKLRSRFTFFFSGKSNSVVTKKEAMSSDRCLWPHTDANHGFKRRLSCRSGPPASEKLRWSA